MLKCSYEYVKNETKEKKKKMTKKIGVKNTSKNIIKKNKKRRGHKKEWVKGEEEPTEKNNCLELLPESFSFLFMKL